MILWESIIVERQKPLNTQRVADPVERNVKNMKRLQNRRYEHTPQRKAQHKAWAQSEAGRKSDLERHRRYRATENGRIKTREKSRRYWLKVKDDPAWKAHKLEVQTMWRHMKKAMRLNGEHTLWLMGGVVKVNMGRAA